MIGRFDNRVLLLSLGLLVCLMGQACREAPGEQEVGTEILNAGPLQAQFAQFNGRLYTLEPNRLSWYDYGVDGTPVFLGELFLGIGQDRLYFADSLLLISNEFNSDIFAIQEDGIPVSQGFISDINASDPVQHREELFFVGKRRFDRSAGMQTSFSVLQIISFAVPSQPMLIQSYDLSPLDLKLDGEVLFVAEGEAGWKVFDASDPENLSMLSEDPAVDAQRLSIEDSILQVAGSTTIHQYDYSDPSNLQLLSIIDLAN